MGRVSQSLGAAGEEQAVSALHRVGVEMVQEISTPVVLQPIDMRQRIYRVSWKKRVSGDHTGIARGGLFVLAEVKTAFGRNLHWSDLDDHQPVSLDRHDQLGGISLLVYVTDNGVHVMRWPIAGFGPGKGISPEHAEAIAINDEQELLAGKSISPEKARELNIESLEVVSG